MKHFALFRRGRVWALVSLLALAACSAPSAPSAAPAAAPTQPAEALSLPSEVEVSPTIETTAAPLVAPVSEPTLLPPPTAMPTSMPDNVGQYNANGVQFVYDATLAQQITAQTVAAQTDSNAPDFSRFPAYEAISLIGYPSQNTYHKPRLEIYRVAELEQLNPSAKAQIDQLKQLLADVPPSPATMPFVPIFNAAQVFYAQPKYVNFHSGQGVRYLTQYSQAVVPINNQEIFYTFQGLTSDGQWYVAALLPVASGLLPATGALSQEQLAAWGSADAYNQYVGEIVGKLNTAPPGDFTPNLDLLDALVQSIQIDKLP